MKTMFLAWQDAQTRQWFPVGRLETSTKGYRFGYIEKAKDAKKKAGFEPFEAFPDWGRLYESTEIFPLFYNRLPNKFRSSYPETLRRMGLDKNTDDPFSILSITGGRRNTDNLEVFPKIEVAEDGSFATKFLLHGWSHIGPEAHKRIDALHENEQLRLSIEILDPPIGTQVVAMQLLTQDYVMIGWTPRYLVEEIITAIGKGFDPENRPQPPQVTVYRVNPISTPAKERVILQIQGKFPSGYVPMESPPYRFLEV